jgi:hypothetical protein
MIAGPNDFCGNRFDDPLGSIATCRKRWLSEPDRGLRAMAKGSPGSRGSVAARESRYLIYFIDDNHANNELDK